MGIADVFNKEDRIEVTKSELFDYMLDKAKNIFIINGLKNGVDVDAILKMIYIREIKESEEE